MAHVPRLGAAVSHPAVHGAGIINLPTCVIADAVRAGRLVPVLHEHVAPGVPIGAIYPSRRHLSPKIRMFIDTLMQAWSPTPPWETVFAGSGQPDRVPTGR